MVFLIFGDKTTGFKGGLKRLDTNFPSFRVRRLIDAYVVIQYIGNVKTFASYNTFPQNEGHISGTSGFLSVRERQRPHNQAFTLVEMLVVMAILGILLTIIVPPLADGLEKAERVACMNNLKSFTLASLAYATENESKLVHSYPGGRPDSWVGHGNNEASLEAGALWRFTGSYGLFRCPSVPDELPQIQSQNRHYSPNNYLNGDGWYPHVVRKLSAVPEPSQTIYYLEEPDPRGYNLGSWVMAMSGYRWVDPVGYWHGDGANFSFVDGHVEYWKWQDPRTKIPGQTGRFNVSQSGNPDWQRVLDHQMPGDPRGPNP